ncbi:hypothetical protein RDABS01_019960 [Bienertia sinuspersici]
MQEEPISPRTAMTYILDGDKPNHSLGEWMNEIGKHPISRLSKDDNTLALAQEVENLDKGVEDCVQITSEDVQPEIEFWQSSVVAFVIGASPPVQVMEGFIRRIWKQYGVDKVINLPKGMYLIRLNSMENRDKVLQHERPFFDSKPMILKPWVEDMDFMQDEIKKIPIWIQVSENTQGLEENNVVDTGRVETPEELTTNRGTPEATVANADEMVLARTGQNMEGKGSKQTQKLKKVKGSLIELNRKGFCEIHAEVSKALMQLTEAQTNLQQRPLDKDLIMAEKSAAKDYLEKNKVYMQFLR